MNEETPIQTYCPGTIVMQYVDDSTRFIGVVVGEHMCNRLDERNMGRLESFKRREIPWHCCLIMHYICDYGGKNLMFRSANVEIGQFPWYRVDEVRTATEIDLKHEIDHLQFYRRQPYSNGLNNIKLRGYFFGLGSKQVETIGLAMIIQHYMAGGTFEDRPQDALYEGNARTVYDELAIAIPRA